MTSENRDPLQNSLQPTPHPTGEQRTKTEEEQRLEILKQKMESERKEKEQALWREASRMSKLPERKAQTDANVQRDVPHEVKPATGLFAKLKLGKLPE